MSLLWVLLGGGLGAVSRYLTDRRITAARSRRLPHSRFPYGTVLVNVLGSLVLGVVTGAAGVPQWVTLLIGTGFCGGLTTFSTFAVETVELASAPANAATGGLRRGRLASPAYAAISLLLGLAAVSIGRLMV